MKGELKFVMPTNKIKENKYKKGLIERIEQRFPGSIVTKLDPSHFQGLPDLLVLFRKNWAILEVKAFPDAHHQPNQDYYVDLLNCMSFSAFINPENEEDVLNEMERSFK